MENKQQEFLLEKRVSKGLLANMWLFPIEEVSKERFEFLQKTWVKEEQQLTLDFEEPLLVAEENSEIFEGYTNVVWQKRSLGEVTHIFSHLKWHILVFYGRQTGLMELKNNQNWALKEEFSKYVFPKPQQKMVELYKQDFKTEK